MSLLGDKLRAALDQMQVDDEGVPTQVTVINTKPKEKQMPKLSASEAAFNYVANHTGCTPMQAGKVLAREGYVAETITALIYQMVRQGMIGKNESTKQLHVLQPTYTPIKSKQNVTKRKYERKDKAGLAALPRTQPIVEKVQAPAHPTMLTADYVMKNISLSEAKALFDQLNGFFG